MQRLTNEFSQDFQVMRLLTYEPRLCTKYELEHLYSIDDFYDFIEIMDAQETIKEEAQKAQQSKQAQKSATNKG